MKKAFSLLRSRPLRMILLSAGLLAFVALSYVGSIFTIQKLAGLTSSNAVLYYVRDHHGKLRVSNDDLLFNEADRLIFMIDLTGHFRLYQKLVGMIAGSAVIETTWDGARGHGILKENRPDGTKFLVILSRHVEHGHAPRGLFLGGDLTYVDRDRRLTFTSNNTGMAYYDGSAWHHLWCTINEGLRLHKKRGQVNPPDWEYLGGSVMKSRVSEAELESRHALKTVLDDGSPVELRMNRTISQQAGADYIQLKIEYHNAGKTPLTYDWSFGDEPWVGEFGNSAGDVGWSVNGIHLRSGALSPREHRYAGYWDVGNELAGEPKQFSGYANFIEWMETAPSSIYFSNGFAGLSSVREGVVLDSPDTRVINLLWRDQVLHPGESRTYVLALGMAKIDPRTHLPTKPPTRQP